VADPRWLLLGQELSTRSSNARVKAWRRLQQQIGAVPSRNSVHVLPNTAQCRKDFERIRREIAALRRPSAGIPCAEERHRPVAAEEAVRLRAATQTTGAAKSMTRHGARTHSRQKERTR